MRVTQLVFLLSTQILSTLQQDQNNDTAPFPAATYPGAESPDPAAAVTAEFSPPFYPSPWGTGSGQWADAYSKARAFVGQLTLLEKVNLTTGVGYVNVVQSLRRDLSTHLRLGGRKSGALGKMELSQDWASEACACKIHPLE